MIAENLTLSLAFFAGLASFLSPCVFALVPAYVSYLGGRSVAASGQGEASRSLVTMAHGLAFVLGFSVVFVSLGLLASALGSLLYDVSDVLVKVGGVVVIAFGLHMTGILRIPFLDYDLRPQSNPDRQRGYLSSALMGVFFSAGWSPCVGPVLGAILTLALNGGSVSQGGVLLGAYSAGLAIPFLLAAGQIGWVTYILRRYGKVTHYIERAMGVVLIVLGVFLFSGRLSTLATLGAFFDIFDEVMIGRLLLIAFAASLLLGLSAGVWARRRGKPFVDWWFLGSGLSFVVLVVLYLFGLFNNITFL
jgi:cytochrome c-type biogenesis protein